MMIDTGDLGGLHEVAQALRLTPTRVCQLIRQYPEFPKPVLTLRFTRLWQVSQVVVWDEARPKKPGRPRKGGRVLDLEEDL